jgi:hypothetical protein
MLAKVRMSFKSSLRTHRNPRQRSSNNQLDQSIGSVVDSRPCGDECERNDHGPSVANFA